MFLRIASHHVRLDAITSFDVEGRDQAGRLVVVIWTAGVQVAFNGQVADQLRDFLLFGDEGFTRLELPGIGTVIDISSKYVETPHKFNHKPAPALLLPRG